LLNCNLYRAYVFSERLSIQHSIAGLLDGSKATTHHIDIDELIELAPKTQIVQGVKFVDNGKVVTSAGITAGIDMSLHVIEVLCGSEIQRKTMSSLEYGATR